MNIGKLSKFQLFFLGSLIVIVIVAVGFFALNKASNSNSATGVTIWGTLSDTTMQQFLQRPEVLSTLETAKVKITYLSKQESTFDQDVVEAIASGRGPDVVMITQDAALQYLDKTVRIPYSSYSERTFKNTYVQEAELFLTSSGIEAMPFAIDPMVMYWNRSMLSNAGIANPPTLWSQFYTPDGLISKINKVDVNHNILKTALALGTYNNINHAKDLLSLLMFQAGSSVVGAGERGVFRSTLADSNSTVTANGGEAALSFYTQFADPVKNVYSWNSALPSSRDAFASGDLALYFGYASEVNNIYARNPNLNFDVALMPQSQSSAISLTFGKVYGLAILKSSPIISASAQAIFAITNSVTQNGWSAVSGLPPVTRDLLAVAPANTFAPVFYTAALQSRGWLDPNRMTTAGIFGDMIGSVLSGSKRPAEAVSEADNVLNQLLVSFSN